MMTFHATTQNFRGGAVKQYQDGNSEYWHDKALSVFAAQGRGDTHDLDRLKIENADYTYRDIAEELKKETPNHATQ